MSKRFYCPKNSAHLLRWLGALVAWNLYECEECGDKYWNPLFSDDELQLIEEETKE